MTDNNMPEPPTPLEENMRKVAELGRLGGALNPIEILAAQLETTLDLFVPKGTALREALDFQIERRIGDLLDMKIKEASQQRLAI